MKQVGKFKKRRKLTNNGFKRDISECWVRGENGIRIENLAEYISDYIDKTIEAGEDLEVCIGTDSLAKRHYQSLVTVICFIKKGHGVHVIRRKEHINNKHIISVSEKLNYEIQKTFELSLFFNERELYKPTIHIDVNPDESFGSNTIYNSVKGWFEALGYVCEYKPNSIAAMCAADRYL